MKGLAILSVTVAAVCLASCGKEEKHHKKSSSQSSKPAERAPIFSIKREGLESLDKYKDLTWRTWDEEKKKETIDGKIAGTRLGMVFYAHAGTDVVEVAKDLIPEIAAAGDPFKAKEMAEKARPLIESQMKEYKSDLYFYDVPGSSPHYDFASKAFRVGGRASCGSSNFFKFPMPGNRREIGYPIYGCSVETPVDKSTEDVIQYVPRNEGEAKAIEAKMSALKNSNVGVEGLWRTYFRVVAVTGKKLAYQPLVHNVIHGFSFLNPQTKEVIYTIDAKSFGKFDDNELRNIPGTFD